MLATVANCTLGESLLSLDFCAGVTLDGFSIFDLWVAVDFTLDGFSIFGLWVAVVVWFSLVFQSVMEYRPRH